MKVRRDNHHWWPKCVSGEWANDCGAVMRLAADQTEKPLRPSACGAIGGGHSIRLSDDPGGVTPWDASFEAQFDKADSAFPGLLRWLNGLPRCDPPFSRSVKERITPAQATDLQFSEMIECLLSLVVRSPAQRASASALALNFTPDMLARKRDAIIGLNMRNSLSSLIRNVSGRGKGLVAFSPEREFIFGDGMFSNVRSPAEHIYTPKMFVPLLPWLAVAFTLPSRYMQEPRLSTIVLSADETDSLNFGVQVYAKNQIFYRYDKPNVGNAFTCGKHLRFRDDRNSIDNLLYQIPGVEPRDSSLDCLLDEHG